MSELAAFMDAYKTAEAAIEAGEAQKDAATAAREALKLAVAALLLHVASNTDNADVCKEVDEALATYKPVEGKYSTSKGRSAPLLKPAVLKGSLLAALKKCSSYEALLAMPQLCETTRKLLCAAPATGVAQFLEVELAADIDACKSAKTLSATHDVLRIHLQGEGRLKKDLMGADLGAPSKKSVRTAANKAAKALAAVNEAGAAAAAAAGKKAAALAAKEKAAAFEALQAKSKETTAGVEVVADATKAVYEMPEGSMKDLRIEDEHREAAAVAGVDALIDNALAGSNKKPSKGKKKPKEEGAVELS